MGPQGPAGTTAAWGDGSGGVLTIGPGQVIDLSTSAGFAWLAGRHHLQFTDITISGTLVVPSGTVLRATGDVTIDGVVYVLPGATTNPNEADAGIGRSAAGSYLPGLAAAPLTIAQITRSPVGGGSGGRMNLANHHQGEGGGSLSIFAQGQLRIGSGGVIIADGVSSQNHATSGNVAGAGGGGGGLIVLASKGPMSVNGFLSANGGHGSDAYVGGSSSGTGGGGGGGGGVIHLISSSAPTVGGILSVTGGSPGAAYGSGTSWSVGAGGGASGGNGGRGTSNTGEPAEAGAPGLILQTVVPSPENLLL